MMAALRRVAPLFIQPGAAATWVPLAVAARPLATSSPVPSTQSVEHIVDMVTQPTEQDKQTYRDKYADKINAKLAEKKAATMEEYLQKTRAMQPPPSSSSSLLLPDEFARTTTPPPPSAAATVSRSKSANPARQAAVTLNDIMKLDRLRNENAAAITEIWTRFHNDKGDYVAGSLSKHMFELLRDRAKRNPFFLFPMPKDEGILLYYFQYNSGQLAFTSLIEYQTRQQQATPYLVIDLFTDLLEEKGIALFRGQVESKFVSVDEGRLLVLMLLDFFVNDNSKFELVQQFNHRPNEFQLQTLLDRAQIVSVPEGKQ